MGQVRLVGATPPRRWKPWCRWTCSTWVGRQRYAFFTNASGGLLDDLMIVRPDTRAAASATCSWWSTPAARTADIRHLQAHIGHRCQVVPLPERALLALQGPQAVDALARLNPAWRWCS
jgi:aminomethyltransferase